MAVKSYIDAVREAMDLALEKDNNVLIFGEDVGKNGGVFRATDGLLIRLNTFLSCSHSRQ